MKNFPMKYLYLGFILFLCLFLFFIGRSVDNSEHGSYKLAVRTIDEDAGRYNYKVEVFNGIDTICNINDTENKVLKINLTVNSGDFVLMFVDNEKGEIVLADDSFEGDIDISQYNSGKLKIKGSGANFSFNIEIAEKIIQ